jgi:F-type H+-transporting ATPase subunit delta
MNDSLIIVRYARALFLLAKEKRLLNRYKADIEQVANVCSQSADFIRFLTNPVIRTSKKKTILSEIFAHTVHEGTLNFLHLIVKNNREHYIPGICRDFLGLIRQEMDIKMAVITTATEFSEEAKEKIKQSLEKAFHSKIELTGKTNPRILGGMILRIDDKQLDASLATQLRKIKTTLLETEFE